MIDPTCLPKRETWEGPRLAAREQGGPATEKGATEKQPAGSPYGGAPSRRFGSAVSRFPSGRAACPGFQKRGLFFSEPGGRASGEGAAGPGAAAQRQAAPGYTARGHPKGLCPEAPGPGRPRAGERAARREGERSGGWQEVSVPR